MNQKWLDKRLLQKAEKDKVPLVFNKFQSQEPQCKFGTAGVCCSICFQGPCRIIPNKTEKGICGANVDQIVARNLLRTAAAGAANHTNHAKEMLQALIEIANSKANDYEIKDIQKLKNFAKLLGKKSNGSTKNIAKAVANEIVKDFRRQRGFFENSEGTYLKWLKIRATEERIKKWDELNILPFNPDAEISQVLHQTSMGNDADPMNLLLTTLKIGLIDGYSGLILSTDLQDIIFGTPTITKAESNLGVLDKDYVNIIVHGHLPLLSQKVVEWADKMNKKAQDLGAKGINVVGMCCTGIELLMRQGANIAGHVLQQEMAIVTGAVDTIVVDQQCIYPSLQEVCKCYHTKLITTIDFVRIPDAIHIKFDIKKANNSAQKIIEVALDAYPRRKKRNIYIPKEKSPLYAGFSVESISEALSKLDNKKPLKPLVDNIINGNIFGIVAIVGCRNVKLKGFPFHEKLTKILISNNILVVGTGCWAHAAAQAGLMTPEATFQYAGSKLKTVLEAIGKANNIPALPPALHMGSCVDNGRIAILLGSIADYLKIPISSLPVAGSAPEYVHEKAVSIGLFFLSLGVATHINPIPPVTGSKYFTKVLTKELEGITGGNVLIGETPKEAAEVIISHIKKKRKLLKLK